MYFCYLQLRFQKNAAFQRLDLTALDHNALHYFLIDQPMANWIHFLNLHSQLIRRSGFLKV
jgi:hypothetical protein